MKFENCWCQGLVLSLCSPTISLIIRKIRKMLMFHEELCAFWRHGTNLGSLPHPLQVSFWTLCLSLTPDLIPKGHWHVTNKHKYDFFLFALFVTHFVISSPLAKRQKRSRRPLASSSSEPLAKKTSTLTLVCYQTCSPTYLAGSKWIQYPDFVSPSFVSCLDFPSLSTHNWHLPHVIGTFLGTQPGVFHWTSQRHHVVGPCQLHLPGTRREGAARFESKQCVFLHGFGLIGHPGQKNQKH